MDFNVDVYSWLAVDQNHQKSRSGGIATVTDLVIYMPPTDILKTLVQTFSNIRKLVSAESKALTLEKEIDQLLPSTHTYQPIWPYIGMRQSILCYIYYTLNTQTRTILQANSS